MGILSLIVLGAIVGFLVHLLSPTTISGGAIWHILVGMLGAVLGGFISSLFGLPGITGINIYSIVIGFLGAVLFAFILNQVQKAS